MSTAIEQLYFNFLQGRRKDDRFKLSSFKNARQDGGHLFGNAIKRQIFRGKSNHFTFIIDQGIMIRRRKFPIECFQIRILFESPFDRLHTFGNRDYTQIRAVREGTCRYAGNFVGENHVSMAILVSMSDYFGTTKG